MARIQEKNDRPLIEVIQRPEIPISRSKPNRRLIVVLGMFVGLFTGIFVAFLWNWWFVNFKQADSA